MVARWLQRSRRGDADPGRKLGAAAVCSAGRERDELTLKPMSDPLRDKILDALERLTDREKFEACAADLLRKLYPTLVSISGGSDAGFDGAAMREDARVLQLVCTTADDVMSNLAGSLEQARAKGQKSDAVLIATSQLLSPLQKRKLGEKAAEYGKRLFPVYDRLPIANLLYHDSKWRKALLNIPGHPPALSLLPENHRPTFDLPPIGRDEEIRALGEPTGDLVVVGQPGSGKTHLLAHLAAKTNGLFVVAPDRDAIADAVRDQRPDWVIIDDAFPRLAELAALRQLRKGIDAGFRIVAACWPGQETSVGDVLGIANRKPLVLLPLRMSVVKQIVNALDIDGPDDLVREILHQSAGKAGLAVTLCQICWLHGPRDLFSGEALKRDVKLSLTALAGNDAVGLLAYFALAGDLGLKMEAVARLAGLPVLTVARITEQLGAAGVVEVVSNQRLAVEPARLRQALVRDVFGRPPAIDWRPLLDAMPDRAESVDTLIAAALLGALLDEEALQREIVDLAHSPKHSELCEHYAMLGSEQSRWVLSTFPHLAYDAAQPLLIHLPLETIPLLLQADIALRFRPRQERDELSRLRKWIDERANTIWSVPRRIQLLDAVEAMKEELHDTPTLVAALRIVLANSFEWTDQPPGEASAIRIQCGFVPLAALDRIAELWPRVLALVTDLPTELALRLPTLFSDWASPSPWGGGSIPPELVAANQKHARMMLADLACAYADRWVVIRRLHWLAEHLSVELPPIIGLPSLLFPNREQDRDETLWRAHHQAVSDHAAGWNAHGPAPEFLDEWLRVDREATVASENYPNFSTVLAEEIAKRTAESDRWLEELLKREAPVSLVAPFADRCGEQSQEVRLAFVRRFLGHPQLGRLALSYLVRWVPVGGPGWENAGGALEEGISGLFGWLRIDEVPENTLLALLCNYGSTVAATVAAKVWNALSRNGIPATLMPAWRNAVVEHLDDAHELEDIGRQYPDLAFEWIKVRLNPPKAGRYSEKAFRVRDHVRTLAGHLPRDRRHELISLLAAGTMDGELVARLTGGDVEIFRFALSRPETRDCCLSCLGLPGNPLAVWRERALLLLDAGFNEQQVMFASDLVEGCWTGPESRYLGKKLEAFRPLLADPDPRIVRLGEAALTRLTLMRDRACEHERIAAVKGEIA